jgi:hypothetical protein
VREDLDPHSHFLAATRMDRQVLEIQKEFDMVLRELDSWRFVSVDMRSAVIIAVDGDVTIGVQRRRLPLTAIILNRRQGLECGFLDLLEPFT